MLINETFIWCADTSFSGINFYTDASDAKENAIEFFKKQFKKNWTEAVKEVEKIYGDCEEADDLDELPIEVSETDFGFFVEIEDLYLSYGYCCCENEYGNKALQKTLDEFEEKFPEIKYNGLIAYVWSDLKSGDVVQYEVKSKGTKSPDVYDFVGEILRELTTEEDFVDEFMGYIEDYDEEEWEELLENIDLYRDYISRKFIKEVESGPEY